jgi:hypothetical protein
VRHVVFEGRTIPVVGCTTLAVFKAMFDRPRDWVDIEAMVEAKALDTADAASWVRQMAGEGSPQALRLEELAAEAP